MSKPSGSASGAGTFTGFFRCAVFDAGGRFRGYRGTARDISRVVRLQGACQDTTESNLAAEDFVENYQRAMNENVAVQFEAFYAPFGVWVQIKAYPSRQGLAIYARDVTERIAAQQEILRLNAELEERVKAHALAGGVRGHRYRPGHRPQDRHAPWRPHLGRVGARAATEAPATHEMHCIRARHFARTQRRCRTNTPCPQAISPRNFIPLVFIYRSPTVNTDFCLQRMIFNTSARAVKWCG